MSEEDPEECITVNPDDLLKIMVATDNHLGYNEKDPIRGDDSFIAFEEILDLAVENDVDFILLGGDLFHDATPSQNSLNNCIKLLKRVVLGDKPISIEFLSDQALNFIESLNQTVNYEDPNLNISLPVFSIHGNHDDPSGFGRLSSLDILSSTGLINYFGKWSNLTNIIINPILLKKGATQMALYGLSHIHDARLARLFRESKVVMETPPDNTGEWFNLMVLHQNRANRGVTNYLPEEILPTFLDLVIWGHEHDCRIMPEENCKQKFYVSQPGSSVATSLSEGESLPKNCGILSIHQKNFKIKPIPLKTVRPFVFRSIDMNDYADELKYAEMKTSEIVMKLAEKQIEEMLVEAEEKITGDSRQPKLPLIRLRIVYNDENQMFNAIRFGQNYSEKVANPQEMVHFKRLMKRVKTEGQTFDKSAMNSVFQNENTNTEDICVESVVDRYFDEAGDAQKLKIFSSKVLSEMCFRLVDRNDTNAADNIINYFKKMACDYLMDKMPTEEYLNSEMLTFKEQAGVTDFDKLLNMLDERGAKKKSFAYDNINHLVESSSLRATTSMRDQQQLQKTTGNDTVVSTRGTTTRGRGRGGRGRGKTAAAAPVTKSKLDVSVSTRTSSRQTSITTTFSQISNRVNNLPSSRSSSSNICYEVSDSD